MMDLNSALSDALSVLGSKAQETVLSVMPERYHIRFEEETSNIDDVFAALDDLFGAAAAIIKERVNTNLGLADPNPAITLL